MDSRVVSGKEAVASPHLKIAARAYCLHAHLCAHSIEVALDALRTDGEPAPVVSNVVSEQGRPVVLASSRRRQHRRPCRSRRTPLRVRLCPAASLARQNARHLRTARPRRCAASIQARRACPPESALQGARRHGLSRGTGHASRHCRHRRMSPVLHLGGNQSGPAKPASFLSPNASSAVTSERVPSPRFRNMCRGGTARPVSRSVRSVREMDVPAPVAVKIDEAGALTAEVKQRFRHGIASDGRLRQAGLGPEITKHGRSPTVPFGWRERSRRDRQRDYLECSRRALEPAFQPDSEIASRSPSSTRAVEPQVRSVLQ